MSIASEDMALATIRRLVVQNRHALLSDDEVRELTLTMAQLDDWLSTGNTLPEAWQRASRRTE